uniref:Uncharacterized protein n=1 Tax=Arundo donax TaxID=35708 RepID=A0A0A9A1A1_ARUDO
MTCIKSRKADSQLNKHQTYCPPRKAIETSQCFMLSDIT